VLKPVKKTYVKEIIGLIIIFVIGIIVIIKWNDIYDFFKEIDAKRRDDPTGVDEIKKPIGL